MRENWDGFGTSIAIAYTKGHKEASATPIYEVGSSKAY